MRAWWAALAAVLAVFPLVVSAQTSEPAAPGASPAASGTSPALPKLCAARSPEAALKATKDGDAREFVRGNLITATQRLPAGASIEVVLPRVFGTEADKDLSYFAVIDSETPAMRDGSDISAGKVPSTNKFVGQKSVAPDATLLVIRLPDLLGAAWSPATLYVYGCTSTTGAPKFLSSLTLPLSTQRSSALIVVVVIGVVYLLIAAGVRYGDHRAIDSALAEARERRGNISEEEARNRTGIKAKPPYWRYLDPVVLCAGPSGRASLSKLQILFFTLIVGGLVGHILLRTGTLTDLSVTILVLLGIAGVSSAAAKGADVQRFRIDFENWAWLVRKKWLPEGGLGTVNSARWRDIVVSDGEFDLYRFQTVIFTIVIGGALLATGFTELATFAIPDVFLGILGLSQAVYLGGKLVETTGIKELNDGVKELRTLEKAFIDAAGKLTPAPTELEDASERARDQNNNKL